MQKYEYACAISIYQVTSAVVLTTGSQQQSKVCTEQNITMLQSLFTTSGRKTKGVKVQTPRARLVVDLLYSKFALSALKLLVGRQEGHPVCKKTLGGLWGWGRH